MPASSPEQPRGDGYDNNVSDLTADFLDHGNDGRNQGRQQDQ
jgi:hypothetical protein